MNINQEETYYIHPSAIIEEHVKIGPFTKIWHFTHVMPGVEIGKACVIGQNVFIGKDVILGNQVKVQNNVSLYSGVECENLVFIGPSVVFTNVINPRSGIERKNEFKKTKIHEGASLGANATILCGITIGTYAFIGAGAVVTKNVKDFALMTGNPAKQTGWMGVNGKKLKFDIHGKAVCSDSGISYLLSNDKVIIA